jgi:hypothetical protein
MRRGGERRGVADVALNHLEMGASGQARRPEEHEIVHYDFVALVEQLGDKDTALIAGASGN